MRRLVWMLILLTLFTASCKKDKETSIQIQATSFTTKESLNGAKVAFYIKSVSNNTFSSSYELIEEGYADVSGIYEVQIKKTSSDISYKFIVTKEDYLDKVVELNPASIETADENFIDCAVKPVGQLSFSIKSSGGATLSDELVFSFSNDAEVGSSFVSLFFQGNQIDTTLVTSVLGDQYNKYTYILRRNGSYLQVEDSVFCDRGVLTQKEIQL